MDNNYTSSFKTVLKAEVVLSPNQLNNDLYMNIKSNLEKMYLNKIYENYGLIEKIYNVQKIGEGKIHKEDNNCDVYYEVEFYCRIQKSIINSIIIAQVQILNNNIIILFCGSIRILVKNKNINNKYELIEGLYKNKETNETIKIGDYFKIRILKYNMINKERVIYVSGELIDEASSKEIEKYYDVYYNEIKEDDESKDLTEINDVI